MLGSQRHQVNASRPHLMTFRAGACIVVVAHFAVACSRPFGWHAATGPKMNGPLMPSRIDDLLARIAQLERAIDDGEAELEPLKAFVMPGGTPKAAALHVARTVCRRAERRVVSLMDGDQVPMLVGIYLNRLSDLLFVLARVATRRAGAGEVTW